MSVSSLQSTIHQHQKINNAILAYYAQIRLYAQKFNL